MIAVGSDAPDFELRNHTGGTVRLSDYRGKKHVVLAFKPQKLDEIAPELTRNLRANTVVVSQLAGVQAQAHVRKRRAGAEAFRDVLNLNHRVLRGAAAISGWSSTTTGG